MRQSGGNKLLHGFAGQPLVDAGAHKDDVVAQQVQVSVSGYFDGINGVPQLLHGGGEPLGHFFGITGGGKVEVEDFQGFSFHTRWVIDHSINFRLGSNQFQADPVAGFGGRGQAVDPVGVFPKEIDIVVADDQELEIEFLGNGVDDGHEAGDQVRPEPAVLFIQDEKAAVFPVR